MRRLAHLSDLHFGRLDERTLEPLRRAMAELAPDLVLVSGDLTQRARPRQFRAARRFLEGLGAPFLATPGNHDVPLWHVFDRFVRPLARYREHFASEVEPVHVDDELAVVGVNTARSLVVKGGRVNREQIGRVSERFAPLPDSRTKVVVTHHPIAAWAGLGGRDRAGRADLAMGALSAAGVDLLLAGHLHEAHAGITPGESASGGRWGVVGVAAGTTTSSRLRAQENGFNAITVDHPRLEVARWTFDGERFGADGARRFHCDERGWRPAS